MSVDSGRGMLLSSSHGESSHHDAIKSEKIRKHDALTDKCIVSFSHSLNGCLAWGNKMATWAAKLFGR